MVRTKTRMTPSVNTLLAISCLALTVASWSGCSKTPEADLFIEKSGDIVEFRFRTRTIDDLLDLSVWQAKPAKLLWAVRLRHFPGNSIRYGEVPRGFAPKGAALRDALQVFPENDTQPEPIARGAEFLLLITCGYDSGFAASMCELAFEFTIDDTGRVSDVRPIGVGDLWGRVGPK